MAYCKNAPSKRKKKKVSMIELHQKSISAHCKKKKEKPDPKRRQKPSHQQQHIPDSFQRPNATSNSSHISQNGIVEDISRTFSMGNIPVVDICCRGSTEKLSRIFLGLFANILFLSGIYFGAFLSRIRMSFI